MSRRKYIRISMTAITVMMLMILSGCKNVNVDMAVETKINAGEDEKLSEEESVEQVEEPAIEVNIGKDEALSTEESAEQDEEPAVEEKVEQIEETEENEEPEEPDMVENVESDDASANEGANQSVNNRTIVWVGDSLTQGSLGDINDNLANAPYVRLQQLSGCNVEGFGFYAYNTHDIFWSYKDESRENQTVDSSKIYVIWVGANNWVVEGVVNHDTQPVIDEIDAFIAKGGLTDYVILGTIGRHELRQDLDGRAVYDIIDSDLQNHYGKHYLEVVNIIGPNGYGPDDVHLTQEAYDRVANAVYSKLLAMGYIQK